MKNDGFHLLFTAVKATAPTAPTEKSREEKKITKKKKTSTISEKKNF